MIANPFAAREAAIISRAEKLGIDTTKDKRIQTMLCLILLGFVDESYLRNLEDSIDRNPFTQD